MMSRATLLLKEEAASTSLSTLVDKALQKKQPLPVYELQLHKSQLVLIQKSAIVVNFAKQHQTNDEGFESDIDSLSIVSLDDSFTSSGHINAIDGGTGGTNCKTATPETDSANGSASSDSDTDAPTSSSPMKSVVEEPQTQNFEERHNLVNCMCYTDVKCAEILVFLIGNAVSVFRFDDARNLQEFYRNFTSLKAVNNQVVYGTNKQFGTIDRKKFNLLHKTDNNGVTHIRITREVPREIPGADDCGPSSIISINTPEDNLNQLIQKSVRQIRHLNEFNAFKNNEINSKSASADNLLDLDDATLKTYRKIWNSTENLLSDTGAGTGTDTSTLPKRPERKKKKPKAPSPPDVEIKQDILSGQYVRVNVVKTEAHPKKFQQETQNQNQNQRGFGKPPTTSTVSSLSLVKSRAAQILKYAPKRFEASTLSRKSDGGDYAGFVKSHENWTNSIPRLFKQPRSKSETRAAANQQPMAYRYIDTTLNYPLTYVPLATANGRVLKPTSTSSAPPQRKQSSNANVYSNRNVEHSVSSTFGNRLFGMSSKLRELNTQHDLVDGKWRNGNGETVAGNHNHNSGSNFGGGGGNCNNLKSVIKKDIIENKKKNEKKVTFSAYTTVQVV